VSPLAQFSSLIAGTYCPRFEKSKRLSPIAAYCTCARICMRMQWPAQCTSLLDPQRARFPPKSLVQKLARPLVNACTRRFSCKNMLKHAYVCMTAFFNDFLDAPEASLRAASYGLERHGQNAQVQTYTCAQQVRASAPTLPTRCFRFSCTLH